MKKKKLPNIKWMRKHGYSDLARCIRNHPEMFDDFDIKKKFKTIEDHIKDAELLASENEGVLPSTGWLVDNGYQGLYVIMKKNPKKFEHVSKRQYFKTIDQHVKEAEELAQKMGGLLPNEGWLQKNKHADLNGIMRRYPSYFSHIKRERKRTSVEEYYVLAKQLAEQNNGKLPIGFWMRKNGYAQLDECIRDNPDRFLDIQKEDNNMKTIQQHVLIAEELAKQNGGILPCMSFLEKNGYSGLNGAMRREPEKFNHIVQQNKRKTVSEYVEIAEKLSIENNGILPNSGFLQKNGYNGLDTFMRKYPEEFLHIKREKCFKTVEDHIEDLKRLIKLNGGKIPKTSWLSKNGYAGLYQIMRKYPEKFNAVFKEFE